jgi:cation diffusion facilitator family transporter
MSKKLEEASSLSLAANIFLFIIKMIVGVISNSIAVISEALNSLTDIVSSLAIMYSVKVSLRKPDEDHQFGHSAAQPLAAFIIALFAAILAIKLIEEAIRRIISPGEINISIAVYIVLLITIIVKLLLTKYQSKIGKELRSPALRASAVDSLNDVLASSIAIIGIVGVQFGFVILDSIAGILIAFFIAKSGYEIARENIDYLMGRAADEHLIIDIANKALKVKGVEGLNELKTYYVGDKFHVEIHIDVDKSLNTKESHDIGKQVQSEILQLEDINKVFIHIDPV